MIYYIRAKQQDWPEVIKLAEILGVAKAVDGILVGQGWINVGAVYKATGEVALIEDMEVPLTAPVRADDGSLYLHANLVYDGSLRALAESVDSEEVNEALQNVAKYFLVDDEGNLRAPAAPVNVVF